MNKMNKINTLAIGLSFLLLSGCGEPETMSNGHTAYNKGEYSKAVSIYEDLAKNGNVEAIDRLIYIHSVNKTIKDEKKVQKYEEMLQKFYEKAALKGDEDALNSLIRSKSTVAKNILMDKINKGDMNALEKFVYNYDKDKKIVDILIKNAENGDLNSLNILVSKYPLESINVLSKKAESGDIKSCFKLGDFYFYGQKGIEKDLNKAIEWYEKSVKDGSFSSHAMLANHYNRLNSNEKYNLWLDKAVQVLIKKAEEGDSVEQTNLGLLLSERADKLVDFYIGQDEKVKEKYSYLNTYSSLVYDITIRLYHLGFDSPVDWLDKAVEQNNLDAKKILAGLHDYLKNYDKSLKLFENIAINGDIDYQNRLMDFYLSGSRMVKANINKTFELADKFANEYNNSYAQYILGSLYLHGRGTDKDIQKGISFLEKADAQNNENAQFLLGKIYNEGIVVNLDKKKAIEYLNKSVEYYESGYLIQEICSDPFNADICKEYLNKK